jgi:cephalosporin hydroxylase
MLRGNELKRAAKCYLAETKEKISRRQNSMTTFSDNIFLSLMSQLSQLDQNIPWEEGIECLGGKKAEQLRVALQQLQYFLSRRSTTRFVSYHDRFISTPEGSRSEAAIGTPELIMSQGVSECMKWKGMAVFKTVFDFSIYPMLLWEVKPQTIIELGSGTGASAIWFADLMKIFKLPCHVFSVDLKTPELKYEGVSFIHGDCWSIEKVFDEDFLRNAPHPWLFIEDAHVNVIGVFDYFHQYLMAHDYVVIEDSVIKQNEIGELMNKYDRYYRIDTYYTDFYGRNATCSHDSIFIRL